MLPHVLSDDLRLELVEPRHAAELFHRVDENRGHLRRWLPWVDATRSAADILAFIERAQAQAGRNDGFQTAIVHRGAVVGMIGMHGIHWANRSTSLGYWLAEAAQGRGLMTQACRAYVGHAFGALDLHRVEIRAATANERSRAVAERLGFQLEGVVREAEWLYDHYVDHALYGLLRSEWRP